MVELVYCQLTLWSPARAETPILGTRCSSSAWPKSGAEPYRLLRGSRVEAKSCFQVLVTKKAGDHLTACARRWWTLDLAKQLSSDIPCQFQNAHYGSALPLFAMSSQARTYVEKKDNPSTETNERRRVRDSSVLWVLESRKCGKTTCS